MVRQPELPRRETSATVSQFYFITVLVMNLYSWCEQPINISDFRTISQKKAAIAPLLVHDFMPIFLTLTVFSTAE